MSEPFDREGGCRCGAVRFRVTAPPMLTMACHCRGCQRMTASAWSLSAAIPAPGFEVTAGATVPGGMMGDLSHHFCPSCLSWLFTTAEAMPFVNVRTTMLDDPEGLEPFIETQTAEKLSWATTPAEHSFERFPPPEAFGGLIAAYAARWG